MYEITPGGEKKLRRLLREAWRTPSRTLPSTLYTAITFRDDLPPGEVLAAIDEQIRRWSPRGGGSGSKHRGRATG